MYSPTEFPQEQFYFPTDDVSPIIPLSNQADVLQPFQILQCLRSTYHCTINAAPYPIKTPIWQHWTKEAAKAAFCLDSAKLNTALSYGQFLNAVAVFLGHDISDDEFIRLLFIRCNKLNPDSITLDEFQNIHLNHIAQLPSFLQSQLQNNVPVQPSVPQDTIMDLYCKSMADRCSIGSPMWEHWTRATANALYQDAPKTIDGLLHFDQLFNALRALRGSQLNRQEIWKLFSEFEKLDIYRIGKNDFEEFYITKIAWRYSL